MVINWMGLKTLQTVLVCSLVAACTPGITPEIEELCKQRGGFNGSKNFESVAGIYYAGSLSKGNGTYVGEGCGRWCSELLLRKGYEFIEVGLRSSEAMEKQTTFSLDNAYNRQEFYRLSIKEKGSPQCEFYRQKWKVQFSRLNVIPARFFEKEQSHIEKLLGDPNKCIGMEKIESLKARYGIKEHGFLYKQTDVNDLIKTGIWISRSTIFRLSDSQEIATTEYFGNKYSVFPSGISSLGERSAWCPTWPILIPVDLVLPPRS